MKIRIVDLLDYYYDDTVKLDAPEAVSKGRQTPVPQPAPRVRRIQRPLLIAASLMLVVTGALALRLGFGPGTDSPRALNEGMLSALETFGPEISPETSAAQDSSQEENSAQPQAAMVPQTIEGVLDSTENIGCYGNLLYMDSGYYTMTENGPEPVELQNLTTTVELYGSWEVDIDYAVVDGELAFRNNTSRASYTIIDGEKLDQVAYRERYGLDSEGVEWITPQVAIAEPVTGSADTVMLTIRLADKAIVDNCNYSFFYNIFTGEVSDPLANVPELFSHGQLGFVQFNSARNRAIASIYTLEQSTVSGEIYQGQMAAYVCDLTTGEMTALDELAAPHIPQSDNPETLFLVRSDGCVWADDDTLLFFVQENTPNGKEWGYTEDGELIDDYDRCTWLFSCNVATGELNYKQRDMELCMSILNFNQTYIHEFAGEDGYHFQTIDTSSGTAYRVGGVTFTNISGSDWIGTGTRTALHTNDGGIYLVDDTQLAWVKLSDHMEMPEGEILSLQLVTDDWLCITTPERVCCYHIPDDLPMTPLTAK